MILDLFAGPGGWDVAARELGLDPLGIEWDDAACKTRAAAGHRTVRASVADFRVPPKIDGLIASPPCPTFSAAGKGDGMADLPWLHRFVEDWSRHGWRDPWERHQWSDPRTPLVLEPLRYLDARPDWVVMEQVPPVLPLWEQYAAALQVQGWRGAWAGVLNAADYGVPQTRKRAILIAHRHRPVQPPEPTHAEHPEPTLFGPELLPWVSMAEALGWAGTVTGNHTITGGPLAQRPTTEPAMTVGGRADLWRYAIDRRQQNPDGTPVPVVADDRPAPALYGQVGGKWVVRLNPGATHPQRNRRTYGLDEPAPTLAFGHDAANWAWERPATTIVGSFCPDVVAAPGYWEAGDGPRQNAEGSIRIAEADAAILQSFPADYPWQGSKTARFQQIGNAVPPLLARRILEVVL